VTDYEQKLTELAELMPDAAEQLTELAERYATWFTATAPSIIQWVVETLPGLLCGQSKLFLDLCPNRRVLHLAKHGRKFRTRKKNRRRAYNLIWGVTAK